MKLSQNGTTWASRLELFRLRRFGTIETQRTAKATDATPTSTSVCGLLQVWHVTVCEECTFVDGLCLLRAVSAKRSLEAIEHADGRLLAQ